MPLISRHRLLYPIAIVGLWIVSGPSRTQELEPRAYANAPIKTNFFTVGYAWSSGNILLDPALPIEDLDADIHVGILQAAHSFDLAGSNAKFKFAIPWTTGDWTGRLEGLPEDQQEQGIGDAWFGLDWLFYGAPAMTSSEFSRYQPKQVFAAGLRLSVPLGDYNEQELLNLGSNRFTLRTELATTRTWGDFTLEGVGGVSLFGDNDEFLEDRKLEQDPLWYAKGAAVYSFYKPGWWAGVTLGYGEGGRTTVDGVKHDNEQKNWRFGAVFAFPIARRHGISLRYVTGINDGAGGDFDTLGLFYTYQADSSN